MLCTAYEVTSSKSSHELFILKNISSGSGIIGTRRGTADSKNGEAGYREHGEEDGPREKVTEGRTFAGQKRRKGMREQFRVPPNLKVHSIRIYRESGSHFSSTSALFGFMDGWILLVLIDSKC